MISAPDPTGPIDDHVTIGVGDRLAGSHGLVEEKGRLRLDRSAARRRVRLHRPRVPPAGNQRRQRGVQGVGRRPLDRSDSDVAVRQGGDQLDDLVLGEREGAEIEHHGPPGEEARRASGEQVELDEPGIQGRDRRQNEGQEGSASEAD